MQPFHDAFATLSGRLAALRLPDQRARPGDLQPADRLLHIAHASGDRAPNRYLCGAPVRKLVARIQPGTGPRGGGVCPTCAQLDAARAGGRERDNLDRGEPDHGSHDQP